MRHSSYPGCCCCCCRGVWITAVAHVNSINDALKISSDADPHPRAPFAPCVKATTGAPARDRPVLSRHEPGPGKGCLCPSGRVCGRKMDDCGCKIGQIKTAYCLWKIFTRATLYYSMLSLCLSVQFYTRSRTFLVARQLNKE